MRWILLIALFPFFACSSFGEIARAHYRPFGAELETPFSLWNSIRESARTPIADGNRPVLPGINGRNLELLQDAVARKYRHVTQGSLLSVARSRLAETTQSSFPKLRGAMAEAVFLDAHPEWKYVRQPNAPQHDVFKPRPNGMPPSTGQIKFHIQGDASTYARDMLRDYRSGSFFVPDDHVESLRGYLRTEADRLNSAGSGAEASARYRDVNRVNGIGATSREIDVATNQAIAESRVIRVAPYVFLGVASTLLVAPTIWDWSQGEMDGEAATYRVTRLGTPILGGAGADLALKNWKGGILRGTLKGNMITACVVMMVETGWQVHEYGGLSRAFNSAEFLINAGGSASAIALGLATGYVGAELGAAAGAFAGPVGSMVGAGAGGLVLGSGGAMIGQTFGAKGTRFVLEKWLPEILLQQEREHVVGVSRSLADSVSKLQDLSVPFVK
jgi:hypothetical protein